MTPTSAFFCDFEVYFHESFGIKYHELPNLWWAFRDNADQCTMCFLNFTKSKQHHCVWNFLLDLKKCFYFCISNSHFKILKYKVRDQRNNCMLPSSITYNTTTSPNRWPMQWTSSLNSMSYHPFWIHELPLKPTKCQRGYYSSFTSSHTDVHKFQVAHPRPSSWPTS